jgi:hypothetical protein
MSEQLTIVRIIDLEQAIQTIIQDARIPEKLRTALAVYQDRRGDLNNREIGVLRTNQAPATLPARTIRSSLAAVSQRCNARNARRENLDNDCSTAIRQEIKLALWHNDESLDWSIEINGLRHEHVTSEVMEALVECAVIVAETSVTRVLGQRPQ